MTITVLLFASYAEALRTHSLVIELDRGATVQDAVNHVRAIPGAEKIPGKPLVAVNERYAKQDRALVSGDTVAIIPPVAGG